MNREVQLLAGGMRSGCRPKRAFASRSTVFALRFSNTLRQIDSIRVYNRQMRELIASQEAELAMLGGQLDQVEVVGRSVTPLMLRMIDALEALVRIDLPFLLDERTERVEELRKLMIRSDVTSAEMRRRSSDLVRYAGQVRSGPRVPCKAVPAVSEAWYRQRVHCQSPRACSRWAFRPLSSTAAAARCA